MYNSPLIVEHLYSTPSEKIWSAITNSNEMKNWYFDLKEFKPEVGFKFEFTGGPSPEKQYVHLCEVTEVVPGSTLTYSWKYQGYEGISYVTFELLPQGFKTLLKLTHTGLETFPQSNPDFDSSNFVEGWDSIIKISLTKYLES